MKRPALLCSYPWTHLFIANDGLQSPCCFAQEFKSSTPQPKIQNSKDINDLWNSEYIREIRRKLKDGEFPQTCGACKFREAKGITSPREQSAVRFSREALERMGTMAEDGSVNEPVLSVDFRLGNLCNLKCRMCHPLSSRLLIREWEKSDDEYMRLSANYAREVEPWSSFEETLSLFKSPRVQLRSMHFAGGEPSIEPNHKKLLNWLIETGRASDLRISYNTNLTRRLDIIDHAHHFKEISFEGSIDGIGKVNDYIRAPSRWDEVSKNLDEILRLANSNNHIKVGVNITVQAYNILHLGEIFLYFSKHAVEPSIVPGINYLHHPTYLSAQIIPDSLKEKAIERLREAIEKVEYPDPALTELAHGLMNEVILFLQESPSNDQLYGQFLEKTRFFDQQRSESLRNIFPDFEI